MCDCDYNAQFEKKRCRLRLRIDSTVCIGAVTLHYIKDNSTPDMVCAEPLPDTLVLWIIGSHPLNGVLLS